MRYEQVLVLLRRYVANDHVHSGCDELTQEAEDLIDLIESEEYEPLNDQHFQTL